MAHVLNHQTKQGEVLMSVKFKKLAIATAVGASLGFAGMAQANNSLLFPYITTSATAYTFVSLFDDPVVGSVAGAGYGHEPIAYHLYYGYKAINAAATSNCLHRDFQVEVTRGALLQFEVGYKLDLPTEFADPVGYGASLRLENNRLPASSEGFLVVQYSNVGADAYSGGALVRGEAAVIDTASGLSTTYTPLNVAGAVNPDFSPAGAAEHVTSWYPRAIVPASWYTVPLSLRSEMTPNAGGGINATIRPVTDANNIGAFARAEQYTSGSLTNSLRCFGTFDVDDLLTAPFNQGGWMSVQSAFTTYQNGPAAGVATTGATANASLLYKLQSTGALGGQLSFIQREVAR
jgi:hypothetical protein